MTIDGYSFLKHSGDITGDAFILFYDPDTDTIFVGASAAPPDPIAYEATAFDEHWVITGSSQGPAAEGGALPVETIGVHVESVTA